MGWWSRFNLIGTYLFHFEWPALACCEKPLPYLSMGSVCLSSAATCENTVNSCSHTCSTHLALGTYHTRWTPFCWHNALRGTQGSCNNVEEVCMWEISVTALNWSLRNRLTAGLSGFGRVDFDLWRRKWHCYSDMNPTFALQIAKVG